MAKISNTTVYPNIIPKSEDFVILTDVSDDDATKTCTVNDFQEYFGTKTLVRVLLAKEIQELNTAPTVILTCGTDEFISIISSQVKYNYNGLTWTFSDDLELRQGDVTSTGNINGNIVFSDFNGSASKVIEFKVGAQVNYVDPNGANSLIAYSASDPTFSGASGTSGTITINIQYRIVKY